MSRLLASGVLGSILALGCVLTGAPPASAQCFGSRTNITPSNIPPFSSFGGRLAISGDVAVISARAEMNAGAVYIYRFADGLWSLQQRLTLAPLGQFERFGESVATDGQRIVVGSTLGPGNIGRALIYTQSPPGSGNWVLEDQVSDPDGLTFQSFGRDIAIHGDMIVVGDFSRTVNNLSTSGTAFIFTRTGRDWIFRQRLTAVTPRQNGEFAQSVAIDSARVYVGGPFCLEPPSSAVTGHVYTYTRQPAGVQFEQIVFPPQSSDRDFGGIIDTDGTRLIIGNTGTGTREDVFIYRRQNNLWTHEFTIPQLTPAVFTEFGGTVAISGDFALVGESEFSLPGVNFVGAARLYQRNGSTWTLVNSFFDPAPAAFDEYGSSIDIDAGRAMIGSDRDSAISSGGGGVLAFTSAAIAFQSGPADQSVNLGQPASFPVQVSGTAPLNFQWRINNTPLLNDAAPYVGTATNTLTIQNAFAPLPGGVRLSVTDACGTVALSPAASLDVTAPSNSCPGDASNDGVVNFGDITTVLANFGNQCP